MLLLCCVCFSMESQWHPVVARDLPQPSKQFQRPHAAQEWSVGHDSMGDEWGKEGELFFGWGVSKKCSNMEIRYKEKKDKKGKTGREGITGHMLSWWMAFLAAVHQSELSHLLSSLPLHLSFNCHLLLSVNLPSLHLTLSFLVQADCKQ